MRIGLISDTHSYLDDKVLHYFQQCDEIWHAGDVGNRQVLTQLQAAKPTIAVYGNIDDPHGLDAPEVQVLDRGAKRFLMIHIAGRPPKYNSHVRNLLSCHRPDVLICGHSHILKVEMDRQNNVLYMNPGAAGRHGFHKVRTLLRFDVGDTIQNLEVIELGPRSRQTITPASS
ncbi:MAG: metallophosphoesterase family protein [Bacteroidota bacterium]